MADIVILDLMIPEWGPVGKVNLVYPATGDSGETVIIDGKVVMENRKLLTMNEGEIISKAQELFKIVVDRAYWLKSRSPSLLDRYYPNSLGPGSLTRCMVVHLRPPPYLRTSS